jgi:hypothetical protein
VPPVIRPQAAVRWTAVATVLFVIPIVAAASLAVGGTLRRLEFTQAQLAASVRIGRLWSQYDAIDAGRAPRTPATDRRLGTILAEITTTASDGHLVNDTDIEQDDLSDAMALRLPQAVSLMRSARNVFSAEREPLGLAGRLRLTELQTQARTIVQIAYGEDFNEAVGIDPGLGRLLGTDLAASQRATDRALTSMRAATLAAAPGADGAVVGASLDDAIEALVHLEERVAPTDRALLERRIASLERTLWIDVVPAFLGALAAIALGVFVARSLRRETAFAEMHREAERLAQHSRFQAVFESAPASCARPTARSMRCSAIRAGIFAATA